MSKRDGETEVDDANKKVKVGEDGTAVAAPAAAATDDGADPPLVKYEDALGPETSQPYTEAELNAWNAMFFKLMMFRSVHGHTNVKSTDENNRELYKWVSQLRKDYKNRERSPDSVQLNRDQIQVLQSVYFAFTTRGEEHWQSSYHKLKLFKEAHGHVMVPRQCEFPGLGDWVTSQRQQYQEYVLGKPTPLSRQRKEALDELGFQWRVRNRPEWSAKYDELVAYKDATGDTKVPQHYPENKALGKWVAKQREQYKLKQKGKHSFLTADREEKLNAIGFVWSVRGEATPFQDIIPAHATKAEETVAEEAKPIAVAPAAVPEVAPPKEEAPPASTADV